MTWFISKPVSVVKLDTLKVSTASLTVVTSSARARPFTTATTLGAASVAALARLAPLRMEPIIPSIELYCIVLLPSASFTPAAGFCHGAVN